MPDTALNFPTPQSIQLRAYEIYAERGCEHGHDLEDWLTAEREMTDSYLETCYRALSHREAIHTSEAVRNKISSAHRDISPNLAS
jgi:Protein of unknown function (DUF2934)